MASSISNFLGLAMTMIDLGLELLNNLKYKTKYAF